MKPESDFELQGTGSRGSGRWKWWCVLLLGLHAASAAGADDGCAAQRDFDSIVGAVTERFYDKNFNGLDWPARVAIHRERVRCGMTEQDVATQANDLLAELHASHTVALTKADLDYWGFNSVFSQRLSDYALQFPGIWARREGQKWYARYVLEASPAAAAGVQQGDELISINGAPFSVTGFTAGPDRLVVSSDGREQHTLTIQPRSESVMQAFVRASQASATIRRAGKLHVGYFHLWGAREPILQSLKDALAEFESKKVDALVIDLRGGYGGTSTDYLEPIRRSAWLMKVPRYFLIDESVRSGKEMLAAIAARDHLAELVGVRTAGAFLGGQPVRIDEGRYLVVVAAFDGNLPDLPRLEGHGVGPTIEVQPCRTYCRGRDMQWEKVSQLIGAGSGALP
jgi:carboxyl-terminal processing protease